MKVHKPSQHIYLSVQRGRGTNGTPVLLRASRDGKIERVTLENIKYASAAISNAPAVGAKTERGQDLRAMSITGLALRQRRSVRRRPLEAGIRLRPAAHRVPVQQGDGQHQRRDLPHLAQQV